MRESIHYSIEPEPDDAPPRWYISLVCFILGMNFGMLLVAAINKGVLQ